MAEAVKARVGKRCETLRAAGLRPEELEAPCGRLPDEMMLAVDRARPLSWP